jgi:cytoskeletal protein RodZ
MPSRILLPLLFLLISACAQPEATTQNPLQQPTTSPVTIQQSARQGESTSKPAPASATAEQQPVSVPETAAPQVTTGVHGGPTRPRSSVTYKAQGAEPGSETPTASAQAAGPVQPPKDVWERIRNGFAMTPIDNDLVRD